MIISSPSREGKFVVSNQKPIYCTQKPCYMSVEGMCCKKINPCKLLAVCCLG